MPDSPAPTENDDEGLYISVRYLRGLVDYLRTVHAPLGPVLEAMRLSEDDLRDADRRVPHALQDDIFAAAEQVTGDSNVGLHAGETTHVMHFGIVGQLALTCSTGAELLDLQSRFQGLIGNGVRSDSVLEGGELVLRFHTLRQSPHSRHSLEYTLAAQLTLARLLAGAAFVPLGFEFTHPEPPDADEQRRVFRCPVSYGCAAVRGRFPAGVRELPLSAGDSGLRPALEVEARRRLDALIVRMHHEDPEVARCKQYIADRLSTGAPSVEQTAEAMGTSVRTLQRRLELAGFKYRDVIELARREIAERHMADPSLSLLDVALLLGFSEQSAFNRAFRRWFQITPGEFRARHAHPAPGDA